jgi:hypothetical protein
MDQFENAQRQRQPTSTIGLADSVGRDLRYSFRRLLRRPTFTLALGIGANTAVFSVVNAVLLKPLSYPQSSELVSLQHVAPGLNSGALGLSLDFYFTYRDENRTFEHLGFFGDGGATVTGVGDPEQARVRFVSDGELQALGVQPMLGRWFSEADHAPQAAGPVVQIGDTVILTYAYWQRKFGGDPGAIGRSMSIHSRPTEIVGVMPAGFRFLRKRLRCPRAAPGVGCQKLHRSARIWGPYDHQATIPAIGDARRRLVLGAGCVCGYADADHRRWPVLSRPDAARHRQ